MSDPGLRQLARAAQLAGHGLHPDVLVGLARHYLKVDLLPGSVPLTNERVAELEARMDQVEEQNARIVALRGTQPRTEGPDEQ